MPALVAGVAGTPQVDPPGLEMAPRRRRGHLPFWSAPCSPITGDEPQVKVEHPQRAKAVRP